MPAKRLDLGRLDGVVKGQPVAVVDALAAPLKNINAISRQCSSRIRREVSGDRKVSAYLGLVAGFKAELQRGMFVCSSAGRSLG